MISYLKIRNEKTQLTTNFVMSEFFCKSPDAPGEHVLNEACILSAQYLRDWAKCPVVVTSSYRTQSGNVAAAGVRYSRHLEGDAIDLFIKDDKIKKYIHAKIAGGDIDKIMEFGINEIIVYDNFIHFAYDPGANMFQGLSGGYDLHDNRKKKQMLNGMKKKHGVFQNFY